MWGVSFDNTVFTYGNVIHCKGELTDDLLAHELVHVKQQIGLGKDAWWSAFFGDDEFRLQQELEAYREQYFWVVKNVASREARAKYLWQFAKSLSGPMYGNIIDSSEARQLIAADA